MFIAVTASDIKFSRTPFLAAWLDICRHKGTYRKFLSLKFRDVEP